MQSNLRGAVLSMYPSISSFARAIHWDRKKASRIINDVQQPSRKDIEEISALLNISSAEDFVNIFFSDLSTLRTIPDPFDYAR